MSDAPRPDRTADGATAPAPPRKSRVFRAARVQMPPHQAARQARIASLAWSVLGNRERVMDFLNADHPRLDARPLALAIESDAGLARVERLLAEIGEPRPLEGEG